MKTYAIETANKIEYVTASSRASAVNKLFGVSEKVALSSGRAKSVSLCK